MIVTTTESIDGVALRPIWGGHRRSHHGANIFRDMFAGIRDNVGGRSGGYEKEVKKAKDLALKGMIEDAQDLGADAVVGVDLDYEVIGGDEKTLLMAIANGTAVKLG
jgi:uncharacterized protein YbjQ (UPF0145 family)